MEIDLIKQVMGNHAYRIPIHSIKGSTGNAVSAGGAHQGVASALSLREGLIPPTANCEKPDPACDLDIVTHTARRCAIRTVLVHTHGSGGVNSALVLTRPDFP